MKKFTQLGIETMMMKKCEKLEEKVEAKLMLFRKEVLEDKMEKEFRKSIVDDLQQISITLM